MDQTFSERFKEKFKKNPLIPLGLLLTTGALTAGLFAFRKGDKNMSQTMMRYRVAFQGFTVAAMALGMVGPKLLEAIKGKPV
mmetsp:Transcript_311/g.559  ORF Transcript_311/g.559 Transcript_311/m.559 type:complete len:82 (+) Transcript_311:176-421(+)